MTLDILTIGAAVASTLMITQVNPVRALLCLIGTFIIVAVQLFLSGVTFIGLSYVVVYLGAIAVLFLFVVMMLNVKSGTLDAVYALPTGAALGLLLSIRRPSRPYTVSLFEWLPDTIGLFPKTSNGALTLGLLSYSVLAIPFLATGILLLLVMVGTLSLTVYKK